MGRFKNHETKPAERDERAQRNLSKPKDARLAAVIPRQRRPRPTDGDIYVDNKAQSIFTRMPNRFKRALKES